MGWPCSDPSTDYPTRSCNHDPTSGHARSRNEVAANVESTMSVNRSVGSTRSMSASWWTGKTC